jgi:hypothetical protein
MLEYKANFARKSVYVNGIASRGPPRPPKAERTGQLLERIDAGWLAGSSELVGGARFASLLLLLDGV